jgi:hypothetical protein
MSIVPQEMVLPFAYAEAVFASGVYDSDAASVSEAVAKITP